MPESNQSVPVLIKFLKNLKRRSYRKRSVSAACDQLETYINSADQDQLATLIGVSQQYRAEVIDKSDQLQRALYHPDMLSRERLGLIFELLTAIQQKLRNQISPLESKLKHLHVENTESDLAKLNATVMGINLWLITLGYQINKRERRRIEKIWVQFKQLNTTNQPDLEYFWPRFIAN